MTTPTEPKPAGAGAAVLAEADAPGPVNANRGFNQLMFTLGHKSPARLHAAGRARRSLRNLMLGKGGH